MSWPSHAHTAADREHAGREGVARTPRKWGENVWPTAQQLADWLKICTDAERVTHAFIAIRDAQAHERCMVQHQGDPQYRPAAEDGTP